MKIECRCGELIHDLDCYSGSITSTSDKYDGYEKVDEMVIDALFNGDITLNQAYMKFRQIMISRSAWQCRSCGTVYINNDQNELECYIPENENNDNELLGKPLRKKT